MIRQGKDSWSGNAVPQLFCDCCGQTENVRRDDAPSKFHLEWNAEEKTITITCKACGFDWSEEGTFLEAIRKRLGLVKKPPDEGPRRKRDMIDR